MSRVLFIKPQNLLTDLGSQTSRLTRDWEKGSRVAVKTHMGEYGNLYHIRPQIVGRVVEELKANGLKPFVYDTTVKYSGQRDTKEKYQDTARRNGFCEETMGCPVIISDRTFKLQASSFKLGVADCLKDIKYHVVISHAKGHLVSGFGGAIKNLGMGCVGAETKALLHEKTKPKLVGECIKCGKCIEVCNVNAITISDKGWDVAYDVCWGCSHCIEDCPENALAPLENNLNILLAQASQPIVQGRTNLFINIAMNITSRCDCARDPAPPVCPDIGAFISADPLAIDLASIDAIKQKVPNFFGGVTKIDPQEQIKRGEEIGLGKGKYKLEEMESESSET